MVSSFSSVGRSEARLEWVEESRSGEETEAVNTDSSVGKPGSEEKEGNRTNLEKGGGSPRSFVLAVLVGVREHVCLLKESI